MAHIRTRIAETVNCYCFNPSCSRSIFNHQTCIVVKKELTQVLSGGLLCEECKSELISKPALEMKKEITGLLVPFADRHAFKYLSRAKADTRIVVKQN
jgi:hypothetical protein